MITAQQDDYSWSDKLRVSIGVGVTVLSIATLNHLFGGLAPEENMVTAVFGVSALCIFLFPDSRLFSPLVLIEANLMASCVAFICVYVFPSTSMGILFAVAGTMGGMCLLKCIHPPAVFLSIFIVMSGTKSYDFAIHPILVDSLILAVASFVNKALVKKLG